LTTFSSKDKAWSSLKIAGDVAKVMMVIANW
jgi:hypothetical protein